MWSNLTLSFGVSLVVSIGPFGVVIVNDRWPKSRGRMGVQVGSHTLAFTPHTVVHAWGQLFSKEADKDRLNETLDARGRAFDAGSRGRQVEGRVRIGDQDPKPLEPGGNNQDGFPLLLGSMHEEQGLLKTRTIGFRILVDEFLNSRS